MQNFSLLTLNLRVEQGAIAENSDLEQVTCDLQRTWRKVDNVCVRACVLEIINNRLQPEKEIEIIRKLSDKAWRLHRADEACLTFLMGMSQEAKAKCYINLLKSSSVESLSGLKTTKQLLAKIFNFLNASVGDGDDDETCTEKKDI